MAQAAETAPTGDWRTDPYLQGVAFGAIASAMAKENLARLSAYVQELRARGADVESLYDVLRERYPSAPTLDELEGGLIQSEGRDSGKAGASGQ